MPPLWYFGLLLAAHVISVNYARINPACECVVYQSNGETEGRFHSPNFPQYYSKGIECILFTFIGDLGELVEINFTEFDMLHPNYDHLCTDYLKLFLFLDRPEVNENSKHDYSLCGNMSSLQQKTFYSQGRSLIMEFHTTVPTHRFHGFTGFRGFFKFLRAAQFTSDGVKQPGTMCSWDFSSTKTSGRFFSPRYPQNYPENSKCQYTFYGQPHEGRVKVQFQNIQIYNDGSSCSDSLDRIAIYDGLNSSAPLLKYLCGVRNQEEVVSTSPYLYIEFYSDSRNHMKGFAANYTFQHRSAVTSVSIDPVYSCNQDIFSSTSKSGEIKSQHYPQSYPSSTKCMYIFHGTLPEERVQLRFIDVDLFYEGGQPDNPFDCDGQDSIKIYIKIDGEEKEVAYTCGRKIPNMFMSNMNWMKVVFESGRRTQPHTRGFNMEYRFLTNYGITTGKQDDRKNCHFTYDSRTGMQGFFTSPNFPGYYPKFTECHYRFIGRNYENMYIKIIFHQFDLGQGRESRCESKDRVDYVDFSNFDGAIDKKMNKICGQITEKIRQPIQSDQDFFRVIFKSNSMYEGKGFNASYQFVVREEMTTMKIYGSPLAGSGSQCTRTNIYIVLLTVSVFAMYFLQGKCIL